MPKELTITELTITQLAPVRSQQSYRHEAFLWHDATDFAAGMVPFIRDGLEAGEPVLVALIPQHTEWLQDALPGQADQVKFLDMGELGRNPARIIPAVVQFLTTRSGRPRPMRGIGQPMWPGRRPEELVECQLHEALLNVAVDPEIPFWLICPYDAEALSSAVVAEAQRSHPVIVEAASYQGSVRYAGRAHLDAMFAADLTVLVGQPIATGFSGETVSRLFTYIKLELYVAGLSVAKAATVATAVQQLALSSLHRGATTGTVRIWNQPHAMICEVADDTIVNDMLLGRRVSTAEKPDGLWHANQHCDLVQMRSSSAGTNVRVHAWR